MIRLTQLTDLYHSVMAKCQTLDFAAPLALRLYLAPTMWTAGMNKLGHFEGVVDWFGNPEYGLGLPFPYLMATLATWTEILGAVCLVLGLATRLISIPLMFTMLVAAVTVHWPYGWQAISDANAPFANERVMESVDKLARAKEILQEHGNYEWLTSSGNFAVVNNGIEFAVTYFIMLLTLFFIGGGRWFSVDHWLSKALPAPKKP